MSEITPGVLVDLIDGLDEVNQDSYLSVTRWDREGSGVEDVEVEALVRRLARERLGSFPLDEIGLDVLRRIDSRTPDALPSEAAPTTKERES